jgi:hypothetical protein
MGCVLMSIAANLDACAATAASREGMMNRVCLAAFVVLCMIAVFSAKSIADEAEVQGSLPDEDSRRLLDKFRTIYALPDGAMVRRIAPPFSAGRMEYYRVHEAHQAKILPEGPDYMWFYWGHATTKPRRLREGNLSLGGMGWIGDDGNPVAALITTLTSGYYHHHRGQGGIKSYELQGDQELRGTKIPGDWVVRAGASPEGIVEGLETILREELRLPIRLRLTVTDRTVLVAKGEYSYRPLPGNVGQLDEYGDYHVVDIFDKDRDRLQRGRGVTLDDVLLGAARFIGRPIYNSVSSVPEERIVWRYSARRYREIREKGDVDESAFLEYLAKQTGLTFVHETRRARVLLVEREALGKR